MLCYHINIFIYYILIYSLSVMDLRDPYIICINYQLLNISALLHVHYRIVIVKPTN